VSLIVHPWRLFDSTPQTSQEVERRLHAEIDALTAFIETYGLSAKKKAIAKVRTQLAGLSALVDLWWQRVWHDMQQVAMTPMWQSWVDEHLLPLMYWQHHVSRTRCPRRKAKLLQALESVQDAFDTHLITAQLAPDVLAGWKAWAAEHAKAFQRASSAVEGRNGALAQLHHNQRGVRGHLLRIVRRRLSAHVFDFEPEFDRASECGMFGDERQSAGDELGGAAGSLSPAREHDQLVGGEVCGQLPVEPDTELVQGPVVGVQECLCLGYRPGARRPTRHRRGGLRAGVIGPVAIGMAVVVR